MADLERDATPAEVLLVEDNPGDVRLVEQAFREKGFDSELHVVGDGVDAIEFLHGRGEYVDAPRPDLVLLDLNLPRKNGDAVLQEVRDDADLHCLPVVVFTSSETAEDVARAYELDANAYLSKPIDPDEFVETVQTVEQFWLSLARLPA